MKAKTESQNAPTIPCEVCGKIDDHKREEHAVACEVKKRIHVAILRNDHILPLVRCSKPRSLPRTLSAYTLHNAHACYTS